MVVLLEVSPLLVELELCQSDGFVVTSEKGPSIPIAQFGRAANSSKSPGGSKLLPCMDDGGHCAHWDLQCLPRNCALIQSCLGGLQTIPWTSWLGLCSDMYCQLWDLL